MNISWSALHQNVKCFPKFICTQQDFWHISMFMELMQTNNLKLLPCYLKDVGWVKGFILLQLCDKAGCVSTRLGPKTTKRQLSNIFSFRLNLRLLTIKFLMSYVGTFQPSSARVMYRHEPACHWCCNREPKRTQFLFTIAHFLITAYICNAHNEAKQWVAAVINFV